jgi:ferric-dicitrate binding protein FerR (iron transport regulator)
MTHADDSADNQIADLLRLAGRRPIPDAARAAQAREAAHAEWRRAVQARDRWRWIRSALAATLLAGLGGAAWLWTSRAPAPPSTVARTPLATLRLVRGVAWIVEGEAGTRSPAAAGGALRAGDRLRVGAGGGAAFEVASRTSVRLDAGAEIVVRAADQVDLAQGRLYLDVDPERRGAPLAIGTPFGTVTHAGTQFDLRVDAEGLEVRVREGAVTVERAGERETSTAGQALRIVPGAPPIRRPIATSGPDWAWATTMAAPFPLEGATVPQFLRWVSREQGWQWSYADPAARRVAERAVLHGTIDGLTPEEALQVVLPAAGLTVRRAGQQLTVSR